MKKYIRGLMLLNMTLLLSWVCVKEIKINRVASTQAFRLEYLSESATEEKCSFLEVAACVSSDQRVVDYEVLEKEMKYKLSDNDYDSLLRIVEAEAGGEDEDGKLLVANVVLNRVDSDKFPDTVTEVIMQKGQGVAQFTPTVDGRFSNVTISEETYNAVKRALYGEDISKGALYFCARHEADSGRLAWFDQKLTRLFSYGHHEFFM